MSWGSEVSSDCRSNLDRARGHDVWRRRHAVIVHRSYVAGHYPVGQMRVAADDRHAKINAVCGQSKLPPDRNLVLHGQTVKGATKARGAWGASANWRGKAMRCGWVDGSLRQPARTTDGGSKRKVAHGAAWDPAKQRRRYLVLFLQPKCWLTLLICPRSRGCRSALASDVGLRKLSHGQCILPWTVSGIARHVSAARAGARGTQLSHEASHAFSNCCGASL